MSEHKEKMYMAWHDAVEIGESTIIYNKDFQWAPIKELVNG